MWFNYVEVFFANSPVELSIGGFRGIGSFITKCQRTTKIEVPKSLVE